MFEPNDTVIHSKTGTFYKILLFAENAENGKEGQKIVVYKNFQGQVFTRPYDEFVETVSINNSDQKTQRFKKVTFYKGEETK